MALSPADPGVRSNTGGGVVICGANVFADDALLSVASELCSGALGGGEEKVCESKKASFAMNSR